MKKLPTEAAGALAAAMKQRRFGIVVVGSNEGKAIRAEILEAVLPLTDEVGPVARILPTLSWGYDNDPPLSARFEGVPVMPSIESAYAHGYRRIVIEQGYVAGESMLKYARDVCFLVGAWSAEVSNAFMNAVRPSDLDKPELLEHIIAIVGIGEVATKTAVHRICDMYVATDAQVPVRESITEITEFLDTHRLIRWEDSLESLLSRKLVTAAQVRKAMPRHHAVLEFLASRRKVLT